ncbi:MAG: hypothetical protein ACT4PW_04890 [Acidimicrobiia bacterium]
MGSTDGTLSDQALAAMRSTAALVAALPMTRARVRTGSTTLFEVRRPPHDPYVGHPVLTPCGFHATIAAVHARRRAGDRTGLRGLPMGAEPCVLWASAPGDLVLPASMVRVSVEDRWWHVAAVTMRAPECRAAVWGDDGGPPDLGFHADEKLEITLVHTRAPIGDHGASRDAFAALEVAVARSAVRELVEYLDARAPDVACLG